MAENFYQFIADCETLVEKFGQVRPSFGGVVFDSPGLVVIKGDGKELEIEIKYWLDDRVRTNPVVMRNKSGMIFRSHGEWRYAEQRVKDLLAGKIFNDAIRI